MSKLNKEECRAYLDKHIFVFRDSDYKLKHPKWPGAVGIESELMYLNAKYERAPLFASGGTVDLLLPGNGRDDGWQGVGADGKPATRNSEVLKIALDKDYITFEPGGQVECSTQPYPCLDQALARLKEVQNTTHERMQLGGWSPLYMGIDPWHTVEEIGLQVTKPRYQKMDKYFQSVSPAGRRMMRQTCTQQTNLDFGPNEDTLVKRYMGSQMLAPLATALFAYSGIVDGKVRDEDSYRSRIWREIDSSRTGLVGLKSVVQKLSKQSCVDTYLDFSLRAPLVFIERSGQYIETSGVDFETWMTTSTESPTIEDYKLHLSLLFPEVRPKGFLEMRAVDGPGRAWESVPSAFFTGLIYDDDALELVIEMMMPEIENLPILLSNAMFGLREQKVAELSKKVMRIALDSLARLPSCYRDKEVVGAAHAFYEFFTERNLTPAAELKARVKKIGKLNFAVIQSLEHDFQEYMNT